MLDAWDAQLKKRYPDYDAALYRIAELEGLTSSEGKVLPHRVLGLAPYQTRVINALARRGKASNEAIGTLVWGEEASVDTNGLIKTAVCRSRRILAPHGITIKAVWGFGYEMDQASRENWFAAVAAAQNVQVAA